MGLRISLEVFPVMSLLLPGLIRCQTGKQFFYHMCHDTSLGMSRVCRLYLITLILLGIINRHIIHNLILFNTCVISCVRVKYI